MGTTCLYLLIPKNRRSSVLKSNAAVHALHLGDLLIEPEEVDGGIVWAGVSGTPSDKMTCEPRLITDTAAGKLKSSMSVPANHPEHAAATFLLTAGKSISASVSPVAMI